MRPALGIVMLAALIASGIPATAHHSNPRYFDICDAARQAGLKDRLQPGISVTARAWPSRVPLFVNDAETVWRTRPDDARHSVRIVEGGQIRFPNGDVLAFGGGPTS